MIKVVPLSRAFFLLILENKPMVTSSYTLRIQIINADEFIIFPKIINVNKILETPKVEKLTYLT